MTNKKLWEYENMCVFLDISWNFIVTGEIYSIIMPILPTALFSQQSCSSTLSSES